MVTPAWIERIIEANDGGWFVPLKLSERHPLLTEGWSCLYCKELFTAEQVGLVMPSDVGGLAHWVAVHRPCVMEAVGLPPV